MDLYSILGQQLSVDEPLPPETAPAAAARSLRAQPLGAGPFAESNPEPSSPHSSGRASNERASNGPEPSPKPSNEAAPSSNHSSNPPLSDEEALDVRRLAEEKLNAYLAAAVERVRYITNASGVALALCEELASDDQSHDGQYQDGQSQNATEDPEDAMVCHASSGPAAPEVGARMYIRSGLTAESIRTRQTLRCDRASTDPRVNQESCKALGIESVMVLPLILDRNVVGMFELFGSKPLAFAERDATTLSASTPQLESALREAVAAGMPLGRIAWAEEAPALDSEAEEALAEATVTLKVPVAFPIDSFRKPEVPPSPEPADQEVPAFLARLADEARPASSRAWSHWFRPQW